MVAVARLESRPAEVRKHAGQRSRGVRAARHHPAVAEHALRRGLGVGRPWVAVQRKVIGACGFADDQNQQRRLAASSARQNASVGADRHRWAARPSVCLQPDIDQRVQRIQRVDQVAQRVVIAHGARQVGEQRQYQHGHRQQHRDCTAEIAARLPPTARATDARTPQQQQRQSDQHQQRAGQAKVEQIAHLAHVGLGDVGHHRRVDHDVVGAHEVSAERSRDHDKRDRRFDGGAPRKRREQQCREDRDDRAETGHERCAAQRGSFRQCNEGAPERPVRQRGNPKTCEQRESQWVPARIAVGPRAGLSACRHARDSGRKLDRAVWPGFI